MSTTLERPAEAASPPELPEITPDESPWANLIFNGQPTIVVEAPPEQVVPAESFHELFERNVRETTERIAEAQKIHKEHLNTRLMSSQCPVCVAAYYSCSSSRAEYLRGW